jgi:hypothetical protein
VISTYTPHFNQLESPVWLPVSMTRKFFINYTVVSAHVWYLVLLCELARAIHDLLFIWPVSTMALDIFLSADNLPDYSTKLPRLQKLLNIEIKEWFRVSQSVPCTMIFLSGQSEQLITWKKVMKTMLFYCTNEFHLWKQWFILVDEWDCYIPVTFWIITSGSRLTTNLHNYIYIELLFLWECKDTAYNM